MYRVFNIASVVLAVVRPGARPWRQISIWGQTLSRQLLCYNHIISIDDILFLMPRRVFTAVWLPPIGRLRRQLPNRASQAEDGRCVPFLWLVYQVLSKAGPRTANCIACLSTLHETNMSVVLRSNPEGTLLSLYVYRLVSKPSKTSSTPIHNLDDDSLLNMFYFCRPIFFDNHEYGNIEWDWGREHWWYKLVQVCRRWRYLIISSALHLRLYLLCTHGTPVADMLAHSPPFPLFINLNTEFYYPTAEDEEGIMLALQQRDRVRRIRLQQPIKRLHNLMAAIVGEFPVLEYLHIAPSRELNAKFRLPSV